MDFTAVFMSSVFWLFIAFCVFISAWKRKKTETLRHETARLLIEKNPAIDSATLAQLFKPTSEDLKTGATHRMMKAIGSIVMAVGIGLWLMCLWFVFISLNVHGNSSWALGGPASLVMVIGAGIIFAARFMPRPPAEGTESYKNGSER